MSNLFFSLTHVPSIVDYGYSRTCTSQTCLYSFALVSLLVRFLMVRVVYRLHD